MTKGLKNNVIPLLPDFLLKDLDQIKDLGFNIVVVEGRSNIVDGKSIFSRRTIGDDQANNSLLASLRQNYHWIAISPGSPRSLSPILSNPYIDAVLLDGTIPSTLLHQKNIDRIRKSDKVLEVNVMPLFLSDERQRMKILKLFHLLSLKPFPFILVQSANSIYWYRRYRDLQTVAEGLNIPRSLTKIDLLLERLRHNSEKVAGTIIGDGLEVIK